ncbi:tyrosine recombinase XerC [Polynucleobacter sp. AP-Kolm-20A-A1]|uniref:tyrosine recombinase XerC n=1 Tax=Polynucleobacter sp. AP-Kolm-20A-A1 TaxID=2081041 RepID=UPI001BFD7142|nr:tyrosine recombinase XerC [Polynucleobacter sp. AP-Kolm-20A-A1]QWE20577.1 tyrosine recombinase XerC [Polynucleobacter sp. AP-Kolm-20A-A1]
MKLKATDLHPLMQEYLHELHVLRQLSPHTLKAYGMDLSDLQNFALEDGVELLKVGNGHVRRWAGRLHSKGKSSRSIARALSAWRGWYDWLTEKDAKRDARAGKVTGNLIANPVDDVKAPKRLKSLPKALSVEQALSLVNQAVKEAEEKKDLESIRDAAIIDLLYSSGLRLSELLGIDVMQSKDRQHESAGWLDWDAAEVTVLGKGGKRRSVPVGAPAMQSLAAWRELRDAGTYAQESIALFLSATGKRLSPRTVQARLRTLAMRAGLPTHVHPHMMRHSFASHVLQSSQDLRAVQEMLGHASIASTQIYTSLDFQHLAQAYDKAHPRAKAGKD